MPPRSSRRRAGFTSIERLALALILLCAPLAAAGYRAGIASTSHIRVIALEDGRGTRAVFVDADCPFLRATSDWIGARVLKAYDVDRAALLLHSAATGDVSPEAILQTIGEALGKLEAVKLWTGEKGLRLTTPRGEFRAAFSNQGRILSEDPGSGKISAVSGSIHAVFRLVELPDTLQTRDAAQPISAFPVQAIALGKEAAIVALSGKPPSNLGARTRGLIVVGDSNDVLPAQDEARVSQAVRKVLLRVGWK
ncbi:MAG TPA: hypothetical protein VG675_18410 [Bryobacteraceae bacterium]|nr:hypothetical protein [Bryobacteraceae bacterium]